MKVVVAGSRSIQSIEVVYRCIKSSGYDITELVSGTADGVDLLGEHYAVNNRVPIKRFRPDWYQYGKAAGPIRNKQMAEYVDAAIIIWDSTSKGTRDMINHVKKSSKPYMIFDQCGTLVDSSPKRELGIIE